MEKKGRMIISLIFVLMMGVLVIAGCSDSDSGANFMDQGICVDNSGTYEDFCDGNGHLSEYYCGPTLSPLDQQSCLLSSGYRCNSILPNSICEQGACECTLDCNGKECGDNNCGGSCGVCDSTEECVQGNCEIKEANVCDESDGNIEQGIISEGDTKIINGISITVNSIEMQGDLLRAEYSSDIGSGVVTNSSSVSFGCEYGGLNVIDGIVYELCIISLTETQVAFSVNDGINFFSLGNTEGNGNQVLDTCKSNKIITEGYCSGMDNSVSSYEYSCPGICDGGVCAEGTAFIECTKNSDCGTEEFIGERYCEEDTNYPGRHYVRQEMGRYMCYSPGTLDSYCVTVNETWTHKSCAMGEDCNEGSCVVDGCVPDCLDKTCGDTNGCGGLCTIQTCENGTICEDGICIPELQDCLDLGGNICESYEVCDGSTLNSGDSNRCCNGECKLPGKFDWRDRHGENWMTSVKDQRHNDCVAHANIGTFEAQINLYYNQNLNVDLSEQMRVDCPDNPGEIIELRASPPECEEDVSSGCLGWQFCPFMYGRIVEESCDPYDDYRKPAQDSNFCNTDYICADWKEKVWKLSDYHDYVSSGWASSSGYRSCSKETIIQDDEDLKRVLIEQGPLSSGIQSWHHAMVLEGFTEISTDWKVLETCEFGEFCTIAEGCIARECAYTGEEVTMCNNEMTMRDGSYEPFGTLLKFTCNRAEFPDGTVFSYWQPAPIIDWCTQDPWNEKMRCVDNSCQEYSDFELVEGDRLCDYNGGVYTLKEYSPEWKTTAWIFKNSWGEDTGEGGYSIIEAPLDDIVWGTLPIGPFIPPTGESYSIDCVDTDGDNFCNWGITSTKPSTCPESCKSEKDWDDSNSSIGALGLY
jgi:hypothetical protein